MRPKYTPWSDYFRSYPAPGPTWSEKVGDIYTVQITMPEAMSPGSFDYYLYKHIANPLARKSCGTVSPNMVTLGTLVLVVPMLHNLLTGGGVVPFALVVIARQLGDCLDGAIARICDMGSPSGALFDTTSDYLFGCALAYAAIDATLRGRTKTDVAWLPFAGIGLALAGVCTIWTCRALHTNVIELVHEGHGEVDGSPRGAAAKALSVLNDNCILCSLVAAAIVKYVCIKFGPEKARLL